MERGGGDEVGLVTRLRDVGPRNGGSFPIRSKKFFLYTGKVLMGSGIEPVSCSIYVGGAGPESKGTGPRGLPLTSI